MNLPKFKNSKLLEQAFIHRSYLNEARGLKSSNETLEFLGDSILSFVVSVYLYNNFPELQEGDLTNIRSNLVNTKTLAKLAKNCEFGKLLKLSKGEKESNGDENQSLLADSFEAFIGALFLDQGIDTVKDFILENLKPEIELLHFKKSLKDSKSLLQEKSQSKKLGTPVYKVINEEGFPHDKIFTVAVLIKDIEKGIGKGKSKQEAEEKAAEEALEKQF